MRETIVLLVVVGWGDPGYTVGDNENYIAGTSSMLCMKASQCLFLQQLVFTYQPDKGAQPFSGHCILKEIKE
jgi:hypothetical protein